ncbi:MAG: EscU/YscU/HrcU family type III secretion system export apparatus switch protein [Acidimicrobiales bacterium]
MPDGDKYARTEKPTPKRKKDARERGQVARSPEVGGWLSMLVASMLFPWLFSLARTRVLSVTASAVDVMRHPTVPGALSVLDGGLVQFFEFAALVGGVFVAIGVAASIAQVGNAASFKAASPKISHISPKAGLQRLFSAQAFWELGKQVMRLLTLAVIAYFSLRTIVTTIGGKDPVTLVPGLSYLGSSLLGFIRTVSVVGLGLGLADFGFKRHQLNTQLKMTKQEVKDERRQQEGDPHVKARLRRQQYAIARSKVIAAVKTADVVVTNPTHFAVALQYDPARGGAPRVVAKGVDGLALRIKEEAGRHAIPVVEDPPLARYLHASCDVEQQIPVAVYIAVARLIAYVYSLTPTMRAVGVHRRPYSVVPEIDPDEPPPAIRAARRKREALAASRGSSAE